MKKRFLCCATLLFVAKFLFAFKPMEFNLYNPSVLIDKGQHIVMDFIGFKMADELIDEQKKNWQELYKKSNLFFHFGQSLQDENIANAREYAFFGQYSLQELAAYKSLSRYVTFVEVFYQHWNVFSQLGSKTQITFGGVYNIFVYDTQEKMICYRKHIFVPNDESGILDNTFKGFFYHEKTDAKRVYDYYASCVCNALLMEYSELSKHLDPNYVSNKYAETYSMQNSEASQGSDQFSAPEFVPETFSKTFSPESWGNEWSENEEYRMWAAVDTGNDLAAKVSKVLTLAQIKAGTSFYRMRSFGSSQTPFCVGDAWAAFNLGDRVIGVDKDMKGFCIARIKNAKNKVLPAGLLSAAESVGWKSCKGVNGASYVKEIEICFNSQSAFIAYLDSFEQASDDIAVILKAAK